MKPIKKFKLNQNCDFVKHNVFTLPSGDSKITNINVDREFYVVQNQLED